MRSEERRGDHIAARELRFEPSDIAAELTTALLGQTASSVLEGDRVVAIRVRFDKRRLATLAQRTPISIGCYCSDESCCHRSRLRILIERAASKNLL